MHRLLAEEEAKLAALEAGQCGVMPRALRERFLLVDHRGTAVEAAAQPPTPCLGESPLRSSP